jgi:hypothetical protein
MDNYYKIDTREAPLIVVTFGEAFTLEVLKQFLADLEQLLAKKEKFVVLGLSNHDHDDEDDDHHHEKPERGVGKLQKQWLDAHKPEIGKYCLGIASVSNSSKLFKVYKLLMPTIIKRMYNTPGDMFLSEAEAREWLLSKLDTEKV